MTGLSNLAPEISGKQLELLKEIVPRLSRVAIFGNSKEPATPQLLREAERVAGALRMKLQYVDVLSPRILGPRSEQQEPDVVMQSLYWEPLSSILTGHRL